MKRNRLAGLIALWIALAAGGPCAAQIYNYTTIPPTIPNNTVLGNSSGTTNKPTALTSLPNVAVMGFDTPLKEGAVGDGVANDTTAVQTCATTKACFLPAGFTFKVTAPIQIPNQGQFIGAGAQSILKGVGVSGGVIQCGDPPFSVYTYTTANWYIHNFAISGTGTAAVLLTGAVQGEISNIALLGATATTFTDGFVFDGVFQSELNNLYTNGTSIGQSTVTFTGSVGGATSGTLTVALTNQNYPFIFSDGEQRLVQITGGTSATWIGTLNAGTITTASYGADFKALGAFNANHVHEWTTSNFSAYNVYLQADGSAGTSQGSVFDTISLQGGQIGLYVGNLHSAETFNAPYFENVINPIVLGNTPNGFFTYGLVFNNPAILNVDSSHPKYANRLALIDFNNAFSVTVNSPVLTGSNGYNSLAPLTFSGGGCVTEPTAVSLVRANGTISAAVLTSTGKGCTSTPTITVGGAGINGAVTANEATAATFTASITTGTMTVTSVNTDNRGPIQLGQTLSGTGVTAGAYISGFLNGTGDLGTYTVTGQVGAVASTAITAQAPSTLLMTVTNAGSGYGGAAMPPIIYRQGNKITINNPSMNGSTDALWPYVVRYAGADSTTGITINNDIAFDFFNTNVNSATFTRLSGGSWQHALNWTEQAAGSFFVRDVPVYRVYQIPPFP